MQWTVFDPWIRPAPLKDMPTKGISTAALGVAVWALLYILSSPLSFPFLFSFLFLDVPPQSFWHLLPTLLYLAFIYNTI